MATAKVVDGVAIVAYVGDVAVDSEGRPVKGAPKPPKDTPPSEQPGATGALSSEEKIGVAIANALQGKPVAGAAAAKGKAKSASSAKDEDTGVGKRPVEPGLPSIAELGDHLAGLKSVEDVEEMQKGDERKSAQRLYKARLEELKGE